MILSPNSTCREAPTAKTPEPVPVRTELRSGVPFGKTPVTGDVCELKVPLTLPGEPLPVGDASETSTTPPDKRAKLAKLNTLNALMEGSIVKRSPSLIGQLRTVLTSL